MFRAIKFCFSLVSFSYTFRVIMFIEAGDVTHRRRGQNRNEEFRYFSKFFTPKFFGPKFVYFGIIRPEMMKTKIFGKIKILTPLIFGPPLHF